MWPSKCAVAVCGPGTAQVVNVDEQNHKVFVLYRSPLEPPAIEAWPLGGGARVAVYRPPASSELAISAPLELLVGSASGRRFPCLYWAPASGGGRPSVLVIVHGGPHLQWSPDWNPLVQIATTMGFGVLAPNYEGSTGYGLDFEQAGSDRSRANQIVDTCHFAVSLRGLSFRRVVLFGSSYGAGIAAIAAADAPSCVGAVVLASVPPFDSGEAVRPSRSVPVAAFQGANDSLCDPSCAQEFLKGTFPESVAAGVLSWSVFDQEGHFFSQTKSWAEVYTGILRLLDDAPYTRAS